MAGCAATLDKKNEKGWLKNQERSKVRQWKDWGFMVKKNAAAGGAWPSKVMQQQALQAPKYAAPLNKCLTDFFT